MDRMYRKLRSLDAYPKISEDFYSRTFSGGLVTLVSSIVIVVLFISEFRLYLHTFTDTKLVVDTSRGGKLRINFDVTFPHVPCSLLSVDAIDISGEQHLNIIHDITKKRIDSHGNVIEVRQDGIGPLKIDRPLQRHGGRLEHNETYCGSCYGAEKSDDDCCNSCEAVREAYKTKGWGLTNLDLIDQCLREGFVQRVKLEVGEGCNVRGFLEVNKVAGNFHFTPGKNINQPYGAQLDLPDLPSESYNITHVINNLSFGDSIPGIVNPLDRVQWVQRKPNGVYQYFTKVVPTVYTNMVGGHTIESNQFSVTEHYKSSEEDLSKSAPGVFFHYDLSPIKVTFTESHTPFLHFTTHICAIIGGTFTVAGIVDSFIYHGKKVIRKTKKTGKLG